MHRTSTKVLLIVAAFALFLVPVAAIAAGGFDDVADDSVFKADIQWLADAGVTKGCNPPANTEFCPGDNVTREQMAAFMHRLAVNKVVDAKTAVTATNATNAANADKLDGKDSTAFAMSGHDHDAAYLAKTGKSVDADKLDGKDSTAFLGKAEYDTDGDGIVDSAEIKIRHAHEGFYVDIAGATADRLQCATAPLTFESMSTVVASGGLSLNPLSNDNAPIYGRVIFSPEGDPTWYVLEGEDVVDSPPGGTGAAAVPINTAHSLGAGTYEFAIYPYGSNIQIGNPDYYGLCELTITAYTGQGASTDFASMSTDLTTASVHADE